VISNTNSGVENFFNPCFFEKNKNSRWLKPKYPSIQPLGTNIYYYISANSNSGRTITKPLTAALGLLSIYNRQSYVINNFGQEYSFELSQNFPNPFNPSTTVSFEIPTMGVVSVKVYDVSGKEVAILLNEKKHAGRYEINFNASNLSSGIYFYRLEFDGNVRFKKMTLLK